MRRVVLLLVYGCSQPTHAGVDAAPADVASADANLCLAAPPTVPATCTQHGLANVDLVHAWTFTGQATPITGGSLQPYTNTVTITEADAGWCGFAYAWANADQRFISEFAGAMTGQPYDVDDTQVTGTFSQNNGGPMPDFVDVQICVAADSSLAMQGGSRTFDGEEDYVVATFQGVLTP